jgi:hypothetical protein
MPRAGGCQHATALPAIRTRVVPSGRGEEYHRPQQCYRREVLQFPPAMCPRQIDQTGGSSPGTGRSSWLPSLRSHRGCRCCPLPAPCTPRGLPLTRTMRYPTQGLPFLSSPIPPTSSESPARVYRTGLRPGLRSRLTADGAPASLKLRDLWELRGWHARRPASLGYRWAGTGGHPIVA